MNHLSAFNKSPTFDASLQASELRNITNCLQHLDLNELTQIEGMFRHLLSNQHFGYVLFGAKPLVACSLINCNFSNSIEAKSDWLNENDWIAWRQRSTLFPSSNFCFELKSIIQTGRSEVLFFHRERVNEIALTHKEIFQSFLGPNFAPESMVERLKTSPTLASSVNNNHVLIGLLMGFPLESSRHFARREEIKLLRDSGQAFNAIELEQLNANLSLGTSGGMINGVVVPDFAGRSNDPLVWKIRKDYERTACYISDLLQNPNFLERVLLAYCRGS